MTTSIPKITVKDKNLKFKPNVVNYEVTYRDYNLSKLIKENIDLFPENKINAAYNAVDRQILGPRKNKIALYHLDQELKETKLTFLNFTNYPTGLATY